MDTFLCKPEVFGVGVQALTALAALAIAVLGLIGLIFYTIYTRNMMKISEKAWQLNLLPSLVIEVGLSAGGPGLRVQSPQQSGCPRSLAFGDRGGNETDSNCFLGRWVARVPMSPDLPGGQVARS
jgi:hypothetical protein